MHKEHPVFEKPVDEDIKIWRYMDFTKFVSLLDRQAMFFTRVDKLSDPLEGSMSKANIDYRQEYRKELEKEIPKKILDIIQRGSLKDLRKKFRKYAIVNCWHMNEVESAAMWKLYLKSEEGIAVQSTFRRLTRSFDKCEEDVFVGMVKYIDYEKDFIPERNIFYPFIHKRKSFQHERELRVVICKFPIRNGKWDSAWEPFDEGAYISVDLDVLIGKIFVSPTSDEWFAELVESIVKKYNFGKEVVKSSLVDDPVY